MTGTNSRVMIGKCAKNDPIHPCDPKPKCDVCDPGDACPKFLCFEKILNPEENYKTRCKFHKYIPTSQCAIKEPRHPCDPPLPCIPGKPKPETCPQFYLCKERIKNPEDPFIRCPYDPEEQYSRTLCKYLDELKIPLDPCPTDRCAPPELVDPFDVDVFKESESKEKTLPDPNEHLYSRVLCNNLEMLKKKIADCFGPPCGPPRLMDPFIYSQIDKDDQYPEPEDPCSIDPRKKNKKK